MSDWVDIPGLTAEQNESLRRFDEVREQNLAFYRAIMAMADRMVDRCKKTIERIERERPQRPPA